MIGWLRALFRRESRPEIAHLHPTLGNFTYAEEMWIGHTIRNGKKIELVVAGNDTCPDHTQMDHLRRRLDRLDELEKDILEFVRSSNTFDDEDNPVEFVITSLNFRNRPRLFCWRPLTVSEFASVHLSGRLLGAYYWNANGAESPQ